jgi:uncharacterized protein (DUF1778 family)
MAISLRIPPEKERMIEKIIQEKGQTKTSFIMEAIDEKLCLKKDRKDLIRELAGWMSHEHASELREALSEFEKINEADWP